ncbi:MAG: septum site-determining protein MinD [Corallococcus sp.]|nr:septum site-determining protein MinD [Corallococcus sp.]
MARKIVVTSGKGGVGKTTVTANLGIALAAKSLRVALLDFDMGLNNLDVAMGVDSKVVFDLVDVVEGRCRLRQALIADDNYPSLYIMPSCHQAKRIISVDAVKKLISKMEDSFDYVLIDCPAGMESGFRRAVNCADEAIVVVTPHLSSVRDASKVTEYLSAGSLLAVNVVVNRVRGDLVARGEMLDAFEIFSLLGQKALGVLPDDDGINCSSLSNSANSEPYRILAENLHQGQRVMYDCSAKYRGFFGRIRGSIKRKV